jgi:hypothetical protein
MMKKIIYILLFIGLSGYSQGFDGFLLASRQQFENETLPADPILNSLIASYSFEETNSVMLDDLGTHNGTHTIAPVVTGANGNARFYNGYNAGSGGFSEVPFHADFKPTSNEITLMVDFYPTAAGGGSTSNIVGLFETDQTGVQHYYLGHRSSNVIRGRIITDSAEPTDFNTTGVVILNQWNRVMLRWKAGETIKVTINGVTEVSPATKTGTWTAPEFPFIISMNPANPGANGRAITGRVDNIMLWGRQLSDTEVTQMNTTNPTYSELANPVPTNFYTLANAANPNSEVNATTGVSPDANFGVTSVSTTPTAYNGTNSLKFIRSGTNGVSYNSYIVLSGLTIGATYEVKVWINRVQGDSFALSYPDWFGWTTSQTSATINSGSVPLDTWTEYTFTGLVPTQTDPAIVVASYTNTLVGDAIAIDNIIITEL